MLFLFLELQQPWASSLCHSLVLLLVMQHTIIYCASNFHYSLFTIHICYSPLLSLISRDTSVTKSSNFLTPKSPLPCRRTATAPSFISFSPITSIYGTLANSVS